MLYVWWLIGITAAAWVAFAVHLYSGADPYALGACAFGAGLFLGSTVYEASVKDRDIDALLLACCSAVVGAAMAIGLKLIGKWETAFGGLFLGLLWAYWYRRKFGHWP